MPDSSAVIVLSNRTGQFGLYRQRLDQETAELIAAAKDGFGNPRVSPDGQWIVFWRDAEASGAEESQRDIMRIPITGGAAHLIFKARPLCWILVSKPPSRMCAIAELIEKKLVISAFDPLKGRGRELTHFDIDPNRDWRDWSMDLSPDGARIAAVLRPEDPISILSLDGQPTQEIRPKGLRQVLSVSWTADGKGLFVFNGQSGKSELFHVDLQGNAQALWKSNGDSGGSGPLPSPDGRHIALLDSATESNAWLMENP